MFEFNLPPAPDGHFWRVTALMGLPMLELRRKVWFFSVCVDSSIPLSDETPENRVRWAADHILATFNAKQQNREFISTNLGDH